VDIEQVAPRPEGFAQEYLTEEEIDLVCRSTDACTTEILLASIWSAKEAALKALQVGLSVGTKAVACLFDPAAASEEAWRPLEIKVNDRRLFHEAIALRGWRRAEKDYVITLVVQDRSQEN
jgi:phosphopantetheinyl transferase (holo-ACP synthase)